MVIENICVSCMEDDSGSPVCPKCGAPFQLPVNNLLCLPPRTILREQYLIGRALGHGGFGITYLAWDIGLQIRLAVKEYMPAGVATRMDRTKVAPLSGTATEEYEWGLERFLEEARVLKKCDHPNIVSVNTVFRDNGTAYLVMEYLEGMNFAELLRRRGGTVPFQDAMRVMSPIMDALSAVHGLNIVHRDVSPENIFIPKAGKVKLIDFGAARNAMSHKSRNLSAILKGGYAPEEQYRASGKQGPWTDVYATAATLYCALTGKVPQPALDRQAEDTLERPSQLGAAIPLDAENALMKAMAVRADVRFQSMEEFKQAITGGNPVRRGGSITIPAEAAVPAPPVASAPTLIELVKESDKLRPETLRRPLPKWLPAATLAGLVVLAAVAGGLWWWKHRPGPAPALAEWPAQPAGIPQTDQERQHQLETQAEEPKPEAVTPPPVPTETAQSKPVQPPPAPRPQTSRPAAAPPAQQPAPVAAAPVSQAAPPPPVVPKAASAPSYDDMLKQAEGLVANKQYTQAQTLLNKAIGANPAGAQAYNAIAKIELYYLNQPTQAFDHYHSALAKGGVASMRVSLEHAEGWLNISRRNAGFKADDGTHSFDSATVAEAKRNKTSKLKIGGKARNEFHILLANGQNYNFSPGSQNPGPEVDFIISVTGP